MLLLCQPRLRHNRRDQLISIEREARVAFPNVASRVSAFLLVCAVWSSLDSDLACAADTEPQTQVSFDQFIDQSNGEEAPPQDVAANAAYRGKRVYKSIFRWIDRQGYYNEFTQRFKSWCAGNSGRYLMHLPLAADCYAPGKQSLLGAYSVNIVTTRAYQGDMTAGHATFYFFREQERSSQVQAQSDKDDREARASIQRQVTAFEKTLQDQPKVKTVGQKICKTLGGDDQPDFNAARRTTGPQFVITAFTEGVANDRIQLRVVGIAAKTSGGLVQVNRLDHGGVILQNNAVVWDNPLLWHLCDQP